MEENGFKHPAGVKERIKTRDFTEVSQFEGINFFREGLNELKDLSIVSDLKNRITKRILATNERKLHNNMFHVLIDFSEIQEIDKCKSPFLRDFI